MSFKIIAVRPLKGCDPNILKNLITNQFYFFDNNYSVNFNSDFIKKGDGNVLPQNFFYDSDLLINSTLKHVNVQGLVGKNGEGKSSIIELLIRILNNFFKTYGIGEVTEKLVFVKGLHADLFYLKDNSIYRIYINSVDENSLKEEFNIVMELYQDSTLIYDSKDFSRNISKEKIDDLRSLFFTMYINYSIYGLDEADYIQESFINNDFLEKNADYDKKNDSWLSQIFHKNDGYQTPLVLHPFRDRAQIDIRNEKYLMDQRLLSLILENENIYDQITEDLIVDELSLTLKQDSLDNYIDEYFYRFGNVNDLEGFGEYSLAHIQQLTSTDYIDKIIYNYYEFLNNNKYLLSKFQQIIKNNKQDNLTDLDKINITIIARRFGFDLQLKNDKSFEKVSLKIKDFLTNTSWFQEDPLLLDKIEYILLETKGFNFQLYNLFQTFTIYCDFWKKHFSFEPLEKLLNEDILKRNLFNYCLIKSFKILNYPKYKQHNLYDSIDYFMENFVLSEIIKDKHKKFLTELSTDDSHITLKLRQCLTLLKLYTKGEANELLSFYEQFGVFNKGSFELKKLSHLISKTAAYEEVDKLLLLPPRIFNVDIYLKTNDEKQKKISIRKLSSGEYQKICIISSVIYHLKNLDSVIPLEKDLKSNKFAIHNFENIYVIFDEIELYFHPEFQRKFIKELLISLKNIKFKRITSINFLFVTHSPFILSDIPKNNVLFLEKGNPAFPMVENTFAANIHTLLQHGFFLNSVPIGEFAKDKINEIFSILHNIKSEAMLNKDLLETIMLVSEPFIKSQLLKLYNDQIPDIKNLKAQVDFLTNELLQIKKDNAKN